MSYSNGKFPDSALTNIPGGRLASGAPARSYLAMRYFIGRKHGVWLTPTGPSSSYRSYAKQVEFYNNYTSGKGPLAARPGYSNHGVGRAVDLPSSQMQAMVRKYGHRFGWGIAGGRLSSDAMSEPWHMTFRGGSRLTARAAYWFARYKASKKRNK